MLVALLEVNCDSIGALRGIHHELFLLGAEREESKLNLTKWQRKSYSSESEALAESLITEDVHPHKVIKFPVVYEGKPRIQCSRVIKSTKSASNHLRLIR